ncbi:MAG: DMT family transporter [Symploca sp. SIO2E9]|nr:DMT family transporter [Symploca sp. SIO2E9]
MISGKIAVLAGNINQQYVDVIINAAILPTMNEQSPYSGVENPQAAEALLRAMTRDVENLRQHLLVGLSDDIERLRKEKSLLIEELENLQQERQQQILQQQQLIQQIAPALANQLIELIIQRLNQLTDSSQVTNLEPTLSGETRHQQLPSLKTSEYNENAHQLIASLDSTLRTTFRTLQQDLSSYQSSLSRQLGQMHTLEQQGETFLRILVNRIREAIEAESSAPDNTSNRSLATPPLHPSPKPSNGDNISEHSQQSVSAVALVQSPESVVTLQESQPQVPAAWTQPIGLLLVLLSWLTLSLEYVVISVIFNHSLLFGNWEWGEFLSLGVGNVVFVLWLKMLLVVPLMAIVGTRLYPSMPRELTEFAQLNNWLSWGRFIGSGWLWFLSQVLIYLALASISPGVAMTIFFIYPLVTLVWIWVRFGARPNLLRSLVILGLVAGVTISAFGGSTLSGLGVAAAVGSAIAFPLSLILMPNISRKLNIIPFGWINCVIILVFSTLSLVLPLPESWGFTISKIMDWRYLIPLSLVLGITTLTHSILNNLGIRMIGESRASILGAAVPGLTAFLAWAMMARAMSGEQILGMLLVSLGCATLSFEQLRRQARALSNK